MESMEDSYLLRHNPLGIHSLDGTDIVIGKAPRHATQPPLNSEESSILDGMQAKAGYYDPEADDSMPTNELNEDDEQFYRSSAPPEDKLTDLSISEGTAPSNPPSFNGVNVDFGNDFKTDFGPMLQRRSTITARPIPHSASTSGPDLKTSSGPSSNRLLIQRMKSIRTQVGNNNPSKYLQDSKDDSGSVEGLPEDVLKMIAYSPNAPWLDKEMSDEETEFDEAKELEVIRNEARQASEPVSEHSELSGDAKTNTELLHSSLGQTPLELNPFFHSKVTREMLENMPPSVSTLSSMTTPERQSSVEPLSDLSVVSNRTSASPAPVPASAAPCAAPPKITAPPTIQETDPVSEDDRGRLFLQINKFVNLKGLPLDVTRNPKFRLSLDNGLQTVTTEPAPLPSVFNGLLTAKIGQEYELVVAKDLELVLTISVSMDAVKPPPKPTLPPRHYRHEPQASTSTTGSVGSGTGGATSNNGGSSGSAGGNSSPKKYMKNLLMRSPKKKQQAKFQEREAEERQRRIQKEQEDEERQRIQHERTVREFYKRSEIWKNLTGPKGEYCRGYVFESHYEKDVYGKARSFAVPLYNEWDKSMNGVPKPVCELQVTMMYVPKLYASEQIPMSMLECQKQLELARSKRSSGCEGFLTQQGGDCGSMWRRRYFTLSGTEMVGHHEATRKRRSLIHLEMAVAVKDTLSDDLWCIYEDRSFQITFEDGEAISFYADTVEARDKWLKALKESVANSTGQLQAWTDLVLDKEDKEENAHASS